ncbi:MAG: ribosome silencing factor [Deltaproteobacteria bacterium]|nr:ribosome silencing factor [Deltaproteobacteria bacterium]
MNDVSRELAVAVADLAADRKALDIVVLDLEKHSSIADAFVICTGRSHIQVEAIVARIREGLAERHGIEPVSVEGLENGRWALIDYGSIVVHVFQPNVRQIYDLERLWNQAPRWNYDDAAGKQIALA